MGPARTVRDNKDLDHVGKPNHGGIALEHPIAPPPWPHQIERDRSNSFLFYQQRFA